MLGGMRLQVANQKALKLWKKYHPDLPPQQYRGKRVTNRKGKIYTVGPCLGIYRKMKVFCSSPLCCGNKRKAYGLTMQERRHEKIPHPKPTNLARGARVGNKGNGNGRTRSTVV